MAAPADRAAAAYFRNHRYIGGKDRRHIIDHVYAVLRHRARLEWWLARMGISGSLTDRLRVIAALVLLEGWSADRLAGTFDGGQSRPPPLESRERELAGKLAGHAIDDGAQP